MKQDSNIQAITVDDDIAKISVLEVPDRPGVAFKLFSAIAKANIRIESIVQNVNRSGINDITFTVALDQAQEALKITKDFMNEVGATDVVYDADVARLSVIGSAMVANSDIASKFFKALYEKGVNIQMISTSEVKISCVVSKSVAKEALKQIYHEFEMN